MKVIKIKYHELVISQGFQKYRKYCTEWSTRILNINLLSFLNAYFLCASAVKQNKCIMQICRVVYL